MKDQDLLPQELLDKCSDSEIRAIIMSLLPMRAVYGALISLLLFKLLHVATVVYGACYMLGEPVAWSNGWKLIFYSIVVHVIISLPVKWACRYTLTAIHPLLRYI